MKKRLAYLLIIIIMLFTTACGNTLPAETDPTVAEVSNENYLPYEGETLTVLSMSGPRAEAARAMIPEFEAVTGAQVEVIDYSYQDLYNETLLDLVSYIGSYDVINIDAKWDGEFSPYLETLDKYIAQDKVDLSVWIDNVLENCGKWQDTIVGIPTDCMPQVFAYRTDLLPDGIPESWMDYRRVLTPINKPTNGMYGIAVSKSADHLVNMFSYLLWSMGGNWADEDWNITINSTATRTALNHLNAARYLSDPECSEWSTEDAIQAFLDGKAAVCETWPVVELLQKGNDPALSQIVGNWAFDLIPQDKTGMTSLSGWNAVIPVGSHNKDLAWEWIKMYTSFEMQNKFYDDFLLFSSRKDFWEQEKLEELRVLREALDHANNPWRIRAFSEAEPEISDAVGSFISYQIYQDTAIRRMTNALKTALENFPPEQNSKNANH